MLICYYFKYSFGILSVGHVNNIPTMQLFAGTSRNTQSTSYMLSLTECLGIIKQGIVGYSLTCHIRIFPDIITFLNTLDIHYTICLLTVHSRGTRHLKLVEGRQNMSAVAELLNSVWTVHLASVDVSMIANHISRKISLSKVWSFRRVK